MLSPTLSHQLILSGAGEQPQLQGFWRPSFYCTRAVPDYVLIQTSVVQPNLPQIMLFEVTDGEWPRKLAEGERAVWKFHAIVSDTVELKHSRPQVA